MARDIIDDRLIGALHLRSMSLRGLEHDVHAEHRAFQVGTLDALMAGGYDGDATLEEVVRLGTLGVGTIQHLDGELVVLDGEPWVVAADGTVRRVDPGTRTPFAVVCDFRADVHIDLEGPLGLQELQSQADACESPEVPIAAVRIHGDFVDLRLRSVAAQQPPYPPLADVVAHQSDWTIDASTGTLLGFRFPDQIAGVEVPGYHLHYLSDDRTCGGHVLAATLVRGRLEVDHCEDLHVELPPGVTLGNPGSSDRQIIAQLEGPGH